jgi:hypothetical protein
MLIAAIEDQQRRLAADPLEPAAELPYWREFLAMTWPCWVWLVVAAVWYPLVFIEGWA